MSVSDWSAIEGELAQIDRLFSQVLELARKENCGRLGQDGGRPTVNLSRIAREACASVLPIMERDGRVLAVAIPDVMTVHGNADELPDALCNVLANAIIHGSGQVSLDAHVNHAVKRIELRVSDEGAGFDKARCAAMFEQFQKRPELPDTGLGLAIVREVARSHGGNVVASPCPAE